MGILVFEDEMLIAMLVEEMLQDLGCRFVGPVSTLENALARISRDHLDGALLDANLRCESSSPAADELLGLHVPFLLVTGYGPRADDPPALKDAPRHRKPFDFGHSPTG
jgi:CheY-like chemotaxis protein